MGWAESTIAADDVLHGKLVCESSFELDEGKIIKIVGLTSGFIKYGKLLDGKFITLVPSQEEYRIEKYAVDGESIEVVRKTTIYAGWFSRVDMSSSEKIGFQNIKDIVNAHQEDKSLRIGQEIDNVLRGDINHPMLIAGINHDERYPHQVILVSKYLLPKTYAIHTSQNNTLGWENMQAIIDVNGSLFFELLSTEAQEAISPRIIEVSNGNVNAITKIKLKIWFPREREVVGTRYYGLSCEDTYARQFVLFTKAGERVKLLGETGAATAYHTGSFNTNKTGNAYISATGGNPADYTYLTTVRGLLPCFHIVADDTLEAIGEA